jgi:hypothetical protein
MKSPLLEDENKEHGKTVPFDLWMGVIVHCALAAALVLFGSLGHLIGLMLHFGFGIRTDAIVVPANVLLFAGTVSGVLSAGYMALYLALPEWIAKKDTGPVGVILVSLTFCAAYGLSLPYFLVSPYLAAGGLPSQIVK